MASRNQFTLDEMPNIDNISVHMDTEPNPRTLDRKLVIKIRPDWSHPWLKDFSKTSEEFWIDIKVSPQEVNQFNRNVNYFHNFIQLKVEEGWSSYWESYFGVYGPALLNPDNQFVLGGAL